MSPMLSCCPQSLALCQTFFQGGQAAVDLGELALDGGRILLLRRAAAFEKATARR
jgi:hypothetical protein